MNAALNPQRDIPTAVTPIVVRFGALGDLVLLTPLLRLLHQRYGRPCQLLGSGAWMPPLFAGHPDVAGIWQLQSRRRPYALDRMQWQLVAALRAQAAGPVYVCDEYALDKVRWLLRRGGIGPERCIFAADHAALPDEHWIDRWLRLGRMTPAAYDAQMYTCDDHAIDTTPRLAINDDDRRDCRAWLEQRGLIGKPLVLVQPGNRHTLKRIRLRAARDAKDWPVERWAALIAAVHLQNPELNFVLCGTAREAQLLEEIQAVAPPSNVHIAATDLPLRRLLALLEVASAMISVDTGPAHAAAAQDCPLLVLFGAAPPAMWRPRSPSRDNVITLGGPPQSHHVGEISVDSALRAWSSLRLRANSIQV